MLLKRVNESENAECISEMQPASWKERERERGEEKYVVRSLFFSLTCPAYVDRDKCHRYARPNARN